MATRVDRGYSSIVEKLNQNGYLVAEVKPTRVGVLKYRNADGTFHKEFRPPTEVFKEGSLESLKSLPLTLEHPMEFLTPENTHLYQIGHVRDDVSPDGDYVKASAVVTHKDAIDQIAEGKRREVSCGYTCDLIEAEPGAEWNGEKYDFVQTNIVYNHLALVTKGRAGPEAAFKVDAAEEDGEEEKGSVPMKKVILKDNLEIEVNDEAAEVIEGLKAERDTLTAQALEMNAKVAELAAKAEKVDALETEKASLTAKVDELAASLDNRVMARLALIEDAKKVAPEVKVDGLSDEEIRKVCVSTRRPELKLDAASAEYVKAAFDLLCAQGLDAGTKFAHDTAGKGQAKVDPREAAIIASRNLKP